MKRALLILFLLSGTLQLYSQTNSTEAKAAYLIAEESYGKGDYQTALRFLESAKKHLGTYNSKMLYLQIQTETELYKTDKSYYEKLMKSIEQFQTASDVATFNEEKVLEVVKTKMLLADQYEAAEKKAIEDKASNREFKEFNVPGWPVGITLEELKRLQPAFFNNGIKNKISPGVDFFMNLQYAEHVMTKNNIITSVGKKIFDGPDDIDFSKTKAAFEGQLAEFTQKFASPPEIQNLSAAGSKTTSYVWTGNGKSVVLQQSLLIDLKRGSVALSVQTY